MGLRINTNVASIAAQRTLAYNNEKQSQSIDKLSSGTRIVRASDDAAGLAISEKLKSRIRGSRQAERNANDGISLMQTAEGALGEVSSILTRLRELSIQASTDTIGPKDRALTDLEYQNLIEEIDRIAKSADFNGKKLLDGEGEVLDFQVGVDNDDFRDRIQYNIGEIDATISALGIKGLSVDTKDGAHESLGVLDDAIGNVSGQRANLGALQNRLSSTVNNLRVSHENLSAANSRIRDTDYALESSENTKLSILVNAGAAVLAQANAKGQQALRLLG